MAGGISSRLTQLDHVRKVMYARLPGTNVHKGKPQNITLDSSVDYLFNEPISWSLKGMATVTIIRVLEYRPMSKMASTTGIFGILLSQLRIYCD